MDFPACIKMVQCSLAVVAFLLTVTVFLLDERTECTNIEYFPQIIVLPESFCGCQNTCLQCFRRTRCIWSDAIPTFCLLRCYIASVGFAIVVYRGGVMFVPWHDVSIFSPFVFRPAAADGAAVSASGRAAMRWGGMVALIHDVFVVLSTCLWQLQHYYQQFDALPPPHRSSSNAVAPVRRSIYVKYTSKHMAKKEVNFQHI